MSSVQEMFNRADPANEIVPRIWLGSFQSARDESWLAGHNIQIIFNCTKDLPFIPCNTVEARYRIPIHDNLDPVEIKYLADHSSSTAFEIVKHWKAGKTILIHCAAGMQRSAACLACFLITVMHIHTQEAIAFIQQRRPIAFQPSANFLQAIEYYDTFFHSEILPKLRSRVRN